MTIDLRTPMTPTAVGYECAAMMRYRPESCESKRIEIYPTSQWGLLGIYSGPENVEMAWAVTALGRLHRCRHSGDEGGVTHHIPSAVTG